MRLQFIDSQRDEVSVSRMGKALGVSRSGYDAWRKRPPNATFLRYIHSGSKR
jgi:hypothetical protein